MWRLGDLPIAGAHLQSAEVQRAAVVQLVEALAMPEFPDGTLRWAPALLGVREYPVERLTALEERSAKVLASIERLPPLSG